MKITFSRCLLLIGLLFLCMGIPVPAQECGVHCGAERWEIKTLTDPDAHVVKATVVNQTVDWLWHRPDPSIGKNTARLPEVETTTYRIKALLVGYKVESGADGDQDFHVVISDLDLPSETMIVEIPDPKCANVCSSPALAKIKRARKSFLVQVGTPTSKYVEVKGRIVVQVTGVGFFDLKHGTPQTGHATTNDVELHPVLSFAVLERP
jgi:hypothetical protein